MNKQTISVLDQLYLYALTIYEPEHAEALWEAYEFTDPKIQLFLLELMEKGGSVEDIFLKMDKDSRPSLTRLGFDPLSDEGKKALAETRTRLLLPAVKAWEKQPRFGHSPEAQTMMLACLVRCQGLWPEIGMLVKPEYFLWDMHRAIAKVNRRNLETGGQVLSEIALRSDLNRALDPELEKLKKDPDPKLESDTRKSYLDALDELFKFEQLDEAWARKEIIRWVKENIVIEILDEGREVARRKGLNATLTYVKEKIEEGLAIGQKKAPTEIMSLAKVTSKHTGYLMQDRIPRNVVTLIGGAGEVGKSTFLSELACRISKGEALPGATEALVEAGSTIYITTENPAEEVLRPRVLAGDGDPEKVFHLQNVLVPTSRKEDAVRIFDITNDLPALADEIKKIGDVRMVVIDPAISHLHEKIDPNATAQVRHVMDTLLDFARVQEVSLVIVMHTAKGVAESAAKKIAGNHQWVDASRAALGVTIDKNDPTGERRLLTRLKSNVYVTSKVLAFRIRQKMVRDPNEPDPDVLFRTTYVEWEGEDSSIDSESLFNPQPGQPIVGNSLTALCERWLLEELKNGPRLARELYVEGKLRGFSRDVVYAAKVKLGIQHDKGGYQGANQWYPLHPVIKEEKDDQH